MLKKVFIHFRTSIKLILLISIATFIIIGAISFCYKPIYSVSMNGEFIGYSGNKSELQSKINDYMEKGNENSGNIAFAQIENLPEYKLCFLKRNIVTNDEEIFEKIKSESVTYYKYYAILEDNEEKMYVATFGEAENVIEKLKEKASANIENIAVVEKYETDVKSFITEDEAVSKLFIEPEKKVTVASTKKSSIKTSTGSVNTSIKIGSGRVSLPVSLIRPVSGMLTSRFGERSSIRSSVHSGLDIAAPTGTPVKAAASGTVTFSGYKGSYGWLMVISHGNGVDTYYGHCSKLYLSAGAKVQQGQTIAAVGSTGNSTGSHLHLEVRVNGIAYNPQNFVY